jgi:hypothetical protein
MTDRERTAISEEAESLPIHVKMCTLRHRETLDEIDETRTDVRKLAGEVTRLRHTLWGVMLLTAIGSGGTVAPYLPQVLGILRAVAGQ